MCDTDEYMLSNIWPGLLHLDLPTLPPGSPFSPCLRQCSITTKNCCKGACSASRLRPRLRADWSKTLMLSFIMCIRLARSSIIWHLEAVGRSEESFVSGLNACWGEEVGSRATEARSARRWPGTPTCGSAITRHRISGGDSCTWTAWALGQTPKASIPRLFGLLGRRPYQNLLRLASSTRGIAFPTHPRAQTTRGSTLS